MVIVVQKQKKWCSTPMGLEPTIFASSSNRKATIVQNQPLSRQASPSCARGVALEKTYRLTIRPRCLDKQNHLQLRITEIYKINIWNDSGYLMRKLVGTKAISRLMLSLTFI